MKNLKERRLYVLMLFLFQIIQSKVGFLTGFIIFRFERSWICRNDRHSTISSVQCIEWVIIHYCLHSRRDILGCAKTGSGKTLAFLIPALECLFKERWDQEDGIGVVIVSPIRELAIQVHSFSCIHS